ncbi:MAG: hypothetical protein AB7H66_09935 [Hyphomonadaceae bacterium]
MGQNALQHDIYGERGPEIRLLQANARRAKWIRDDTSHRAAALLEHKSNYRRAAATAAKAHRNAEWEWRSHLREHRNQDIRTKLKQQSGLLPLLRLVLLCELGANAIELGLDKAASAFSRAASCLWILWDQFVAYASRLSPWLVDWNGRPITVLGVSLLTLLGISALTVAALDLAHIEPRWPPWQSKIQWFWDNGQDHEVSESVEVEPTIHLELLFPTNRQSHVWSMNDATALTRGFDNRPATAQQYWSTSVCTDVDIIALGTASLEGPDARNRELSRSRALLLAREALRRIENCPSSPRVFAFAARAPREPEGDGSQRRAAVVSVAGRMANDDSSQLVTLLDTTNFVPEVATGLHTYSHLEWCELLEGRCEWRSVR